MKRVVIVQARMRSTRLPGKVLMDLAGRPMLAQQLSRLKKCQLADEIIVATTKGTEDRSIVRLARQECVGCFCGSEQDVLSRYVGAAMKVHADVVVRITADCPLVDPEIIDKVIAELIDHGTECDYASNVLQRTFPRGMDVEAMFIDTLRRMDRLSQSKLAREHVTIFLRSERPDLFITRSVEDQENNSDLRWTVDTEQDLKFVRALYESLSLQDSLVPYADLLGFVRSRQDLIHLDGTDNTWDPIRREVS